MTDFWLLTGLLLIAGVVSIAWPLWKHRHQQQVDRTALNVALYQERQAELDAAVAAGDLTAQERDATLEEASKLLLEDTAQADDGARPRKRGGPWMIIVAAALSPVLVLFLYFAWGNPDGLQLVREMEASPQPQSLELAIDRMERITQVQPQNGEAWFMLGRAYLTAQQPERAVLALGNSLERLGERPEVLAQLAQARYFAAGNQLDTAAVAALDKALELDPQEPTALGLLGIAAFESGDYPSAIEYWQQLLAGMPEGSTGAQAIQGGINRARERMGDPDTEADAGADSATQEQTTDSAVIRVRLDIDAEIAGQMGEEAAVYLFARDPQGPPMPLVARRFALAELPVDVILSSADAMLPDVRLSEGQRLQLSARLSPTGDALQGSHQGVVEDVVVGAEERFEVTVDQVIQPR